MGALIKSQILLSTIGAAGQAGQVNSGVTGATSGFELDMESLLSPEVAGAALPSPDRLLEAFTAKAGHLFEFGGLFSFEVGHRQFPADRLGTRTRNSR